MPWVFGSVQVLTLVFLCALLVYVRRRRTDKEGQARLTACLNVVESRAQELERASELYRRKMEDGLKRLAGICDKASELVERGFEFSHFSPSEEERELKSIVPDARNEIPQVQEIERTRHRLREELKIERSALLRDQLA